MADRQIAREDRNVIDAGDIVHAVWIGDVARPAGQIDNGIGLFLH